MNEINTLQQLIESLDDADPYERKKIVNHINIPPSEFSPFCYWNEGDYTRNCIEKTPEYELILICWNAHVQTSVHGHDEQDCWVYMVEGELEEKRFDDNLNVTNSMILTENKLTYMHDRMGYHAIINHTNKKAMSLHLYASPITSCEVYNTELDQFETKELCYDTIKGKVNTLV